VGQQQLRDPGRAALDARQGHVRVIFPFNTPAADIAADVEYLLNR
jgi:hypothetical protein